MPAERGCCMNALDRQELIRRELEAIRREFESSTSSTGSRDVSALVVCIHQHCFDPEFNISRALEECAIRSAGIFARFKNEIGLTPRQHLERCRIAGAVRLLRYPELRVYEAAHGVGYKEQSRFNKAFKRNLHCSPTSYRVMFHHGSGDGAMYPSLRMAHTHRKLKRGY